MEKWEGAWVLVTSMANPSGLGGTETGRGTLRHCPPNLKGAEVPAAWSGSGNAGLREGHFTVACCASGGLLLGGLAVLGGGHTPSGI